MAAPVVTDSIQVPIARISYIWAGKPGRAAPEIVGWYNEFEAMLRERRFQDAPTAPTLFSRRMQQQLWRSVKDIHDDMLRLAAGRCILFGMKDPFRVIKYGDFYLPRSGNQRLCILRSQDYGDCQCHNGLVPCLLMSG